MRERIEETTGLDTYRMVVKYLVAGLAPDPTEYADQLEADPDAITRRARILGPDVDTYDIREMYLTIESSLNSALTSTGLERSWDGAAADAFTDSYLKALGTHLTNLAGLCEKQRAVATRIASAIRDAQEVLVEDVYDMVLWVNLYAAGASNAALWAGAASGGLASAAAGSAVLQAMITQLVEDHRSIQRKISELNQTLGGEILEEVRGLESESFDGVLNTSVTTDAWHTRAG
ncbi:MAG: hypothetical protein ACRDT4_16010 [Micromonosporaceae bacterium]